MSELVFVDTNVFVYARDAAESKKQPIAAGWLARLWHEQRGRTSIQVLNEYYVTVTRELEPGLKRADAWEDIQAILAWHPQAIDAALIRRARDIEDRHRLSWWDSLVVGAAQMQNCDILLSEDLQDRGEYGGLTVRSPFTFEVEEPTAGYASPSTAAGSHPKRGRPIRSR
ncbi:MAG: PIN domain-containing protein [Dokdonella sp.]